MLSLLSWLLTLISLFLSPSRCCLCDQDKPGGTSPLVNTYDAVALPASPLALAMGLLTHLPV